MKVLIAVTNDEASGDAVDMANRLLVDPSVERYVLCVAPVVASDDPVDREREQSFLDWDAHKAVSRFASEVVHAERTVEHGEPGRAICEVALERSVDLIIVGTHDRSVWDRIWGHSVSDYVVHHAHCSVLVVR